MNEKTYRDDFRNHFMHEVKNPKLQHQNRPACLAEAPLQYFQEQILKSHQKIQGLEATLISKQKHFGQASTSGGDADRTMYQYPFAEKSGADSFRQNNNNHNCCMKHLPAPNKQSIQAIASNSFRKYQKSSIVGDGLSDHRLLYENDSNLGGLGGNGSEDSGKSQKSSKTVVSRKSSQDLRKFVTSQCKLHEAIDETIKQMCSTDINKTVDNNPESKLQEPPPFEKFPLALTHCKRCSERLHPVQSQKNVMTEIGKDDLTEQQNTISVNDLVSSKVINPMIRKLQRLYLNNLKEELSLMDDLERLPNKVIEVYKAPMFKQND